MATLNGRLLGPGRDTGGVSSAASSGATPPKPAASQRETFLDAVRAIALIRVVIWHTFGVAAITYFVAAMPAMFFVSGSLLAKSMGRRRPVTVLADRFRRLLVPLWAFALVAWGVMALVAGRQGTDLPLERAAAWLLPLTDPRGTAWESGWLSSHLWYLRTLTWLFLLSPLLFKAVRANRRLALGIPLAAVLVLDLAARDASSPFAGATAWAVGDVALYAVFFLAGALHRDGLFRRVRRPGWIAVAMVAAAAAAAWRLTQPVPLGVVNNSHPMHLLVGTAWLAVAMAVQGPLARLATAPVAGAAVRAIGRRSLTIYLWHTAAIIVAVNALEWRNVQDPLAYNVGLVVLTALGVLVAVRLFGWVEDVAARRPRVGPVPRLAVVPVPQRIAVATVAALAAGVLLTSSTTPVAAPLAGEASQAPAEASRGVRRPPIPSRPPPAPVFDAARTTGPAEPSRAVLDGRNDLAGRLDQVLAEWAGNNRVKGALAGLSVGADVRWTGAVGTRPDTGVPVRPTDAVDLASLTKLFTATLVYRAADAGLIDVFAPLPYFAALPDFPYAEGITVAQLLDHSSGLVNYRDTTPYLADPSSISGAVAAVMASVEEPRMSAPGEAYNYSSTNFLILGLLLEQATGRPIGDLLREGFIAPLDLRSTIHLPPKPGEPRGATSGLVTTIADLLHAGVAILRDHAGLSEKSAALMSTIDTQTGYGLGTFGFCPCRIDWAGVPRFLAVGYYGATTLLAYLPSLDVTLAIDLVDSLWEGDQYAPVTDLIERIERLALDS